jgi:hypothetical protein
VPALAVATLAAFLGATIRLLTAILVSGIRSRQRIVHFTLHKTSVKRK